MWCKATINSYAHWGHVETIRWIFFSANSWRKIEKRIASSEDRGGGHRQFPNRSTAVARIILCRHLYALETRKRRIITGRRRFVFSFGRVHVAFSLFTLENIGISWRDSFSESWREDFRDLIAVDRLRHLFMDAYRTHVPCFNWYILVRVYTYNIYTHIHTHLYCIYIFRERKEEKSSLVA